MRTLTPSRVRRPILLAPGLAAAGTLALAACTTALPGESADSTGPDDASPQTLTILLDDTVDSIDPTVAMASGGRQITWMAYEALVRTDPTTGEAVPGIAEEFDYDATSAHFRIREGVMCADGTEITAGTVARNFERWKDPATNAPLVNNFFGDANFTVEYDDAARTVDVDMSSTPSPLRGAVPSFTLLGIICDSGLDDPSVLSSASHGTAPYAIAEYVVGSHATLERNDDYAWAPIADFDVADLPATVRFDIVADADTQVNLLLGGDADTAVLAPTQRERLQDQEVTTQVASTGVMMMLFNENEGHAGHDTAVRQALAQAIDFDELATVQGDGTYSANFLRAPDNVCVDEQAIADVFPAGGVEVAQDTLEEAGYTLNDDGLYERDGQPISITLLGLELKTPSAEFVMARWREVGVEVSYDDRATSQGIDQLYTGTGWDVTFVGFQADLPTGFRQFFVGPAAPDGPNFGAVDNPTYNQLQDEANQVEGIDGCDLWIQAESAIVERADWVPALASDDEWVLRPGVEFFSHDSFIDPLTLRKN